MANSDHGSCGCATLGVAFHIVLAKPAARRNPPKIGRDEVGWVKLGMQVQYFSPPHLRAKKLKKYINKFNLIFLMS